MAFCGVYLLRCVCVASDVGYALVGSWRDPGYLSPVYVEPGHNYPLR